MKYYVTADLHGFYMEFQDAPGHFVELFNTLDAFVLQWVGDMPDNTYRSFSKFLTPEQAEEMRTRLKRNN